eukprot:8367619-Prorocentrum_lima.AAC.1
MHFSWAVLFVDVTSAFTNASRYLLFGSLLGPEEAGLELGRLGLSPVTISFLLDEVSLHGSLLGRLGLPEDLISLFRQFNEQ